MRAIVEPDLIFPLLRGRDVGRWLASPSAHILVAQDPARRTGYEEAWLRESYPRTYDYLTEFAGALRERSGYKKYFDSSRDPFYSIYNVSEHTFANHKVVWREQASSFTVAPIQQTNPPTIPDHKLMMVPCQGPDEVSYLTAVLNSSIAGFVVASYVVAVSTSTHVLDYIAIPDFDNSNSAHQAIVHLSDSVVAVAAGGGKGMELTELESEIDRHVGALWGLSAKEIRAIEDAARSAYSRLS